MLCRVMEFHVSHIEFRSDPLNPHHNKSFVSLVPTNKCVPLALKEVQRLVSQVERLKSYKGVLEIELALYVSKMKVLL